VEVIEICQQPQVGGAVLAVHAVDHANGVSGGQKRIPGCAADRLDQHGRVNPVRRACGVAEVLGSDVVLCGGRLAVDAIAVERVEGAGAECFGDADGDLDVVAERLRQCGIGQNPTIAGGHVACSEIESGQLDARVLDGADERGDIGVRGRRGVERPPELDGLEARVARCAWPVQQW